MRRIDYGGPLSVSRQTLYALHRAHLLAIPFENLSVQGGAVPSLDLESLFEKIVTERRGGWCYEMNALFAWVLRELGFTVTYLAGAVARDKHGTTAEMNHLTLLVSLDGPFLADVGFGNGFLTPLPLREGTHNDGRFDFRLTREGDWWRFHNHRHDGSTYDFELTPRSLDDFTEKARELSSGPQSLFATNLICARLTDDGAALLTNALFKQIGASEIREETAPTASALQTILRETFALNVEVSPELWERVSSQHRAMLRRRIRGF